MKLINGVLKEGRYKKKGRTLDKIWRDSNWSENRYPGPPEPRKGQSRYILHLHTYIPPKFLKMKKENRNRNI